jgi:acid phosphatase (class A)
LLTLLPVSLLTLSACAVFDTGYQTNASPTVNAATDPRHIPRTSQGRAEGYLKAAELADSTRFLIMPPINGSPAKAADEDIAKRMTDNYYDSDRWLLAALDAELDDPIAVNHFSCQIGLDVSLDNTPHLYALLLRSMSTSSSTADAMKQKAMRQRPFAQGKARPFGPNSDKTCRPDSEAHLLGNGSYPSGHTSMGYVMGLVLAQVDPGNATNLMQRARQYSESRSVCNAHWYSDIQAGREIAAVAFSVLNANASYLADLAAARVEYQAVKAKNAGKVPAKQYRILAEDNNPVIKHIKDKLSDWNCSKEQSTLDNFPGLLSR